MGLLKKIYYSNIFRYIVTPAIGFGIGGAIWGWQMDKYSSNEVFISPFMGLYGGIALGMLGGLSLTIFSRNIFHSIIRGFLGCIVGLVFGFLAFDAISIFGMQVLPSILASLALLIIPFSLSGVLITAFYILPLKVKTFPASFYGGGLFGLSFLGGNISGAIIGQGIFSSTLIHNITSFTVMGIVLGLFLGVMIYKDHKITSGGMKN